MDLVLLLIIGLFELSDALVQLKLVYLPLEAAFVGLLQLLFEMVLHFAELVAQPLLQFRVLCGALFLTRFGFLRDSLDLFLSLFEHRR